MKLYASKAKIFGQLLLGLFLLVIVGFAIVAAYTGPSVDPSQEPREWFFRILAPVAMILMIGMQVFWVRRLLDKNPALQVDERGIDTGSSRFGFFKWDELANIFVRELQVGITRKMYLLILIPRDIEGVMKRYTGYTLKRAQSSLKQHSGLMIMLHALPGNPQELGGAVAEYGQQQIVANPNLPPVMMTAPPRI